MAISGLSHPSVFVSPASQSYPVGDGIILVMSLAWALIILAYLVNFQSKWRMLAMTVVFAGMTASYYAMGEFAMRLENPFWIENGNADLIIAQFGGWSRILAILSLAFPFFVVLAMQGLYKSSVLSGSRNSNLVRRLVSFYVPIINLWKPYQILKEILVATGRGKWTWLLFSWWFIARFVMLSVVLIASSSATRSIESGIGKVSVETNDRTTFSLVRESTLSVLSGEMSEDDAFDRYPHIAQHPESFKNFVADVRAGKITSNESAYFRYPEFFPYAEDFKKSGEFISLAIILDCIITASWILVISLVSKGDSKGRHVSISMTITKIIKRFRKTGIDDYYETALSELEERKANRKTWAKALVDSGGDPDKTKALYVKYRASAMLAESKLSEDS